MRLIYLWTTRLILTISLAGILPLPNQSAIVQAQSKKKNPAQASKYAKRANSKAKKKTKYCRNYLDKKMEQSDTPIYGINTGFGALCNNKIIKNTFLKS